MAEDSLLSDRTSQLNNIQKNKLEQQKELGRKRSELVLAMDQAQPLLDQQRKLQSHVMHPDSPLEDNTIRPETYRRLVNIEREAVQVLSDSPHTSPLRRPRTAQDTSPSLRPRSSGQNFHVGAHRVRQLPSTSRHHDIDLATEIGEGLVEEVRKLQAQLFEKDELLKEVTRNRVKQERIAEQLEVRMRTMLADEEKLKNINWELELTLQQKEEGQASLNELTSKLESDLVKSNSICSKQVEEIEVLQETRQDLESKVSELQTTQAVALAKQKEIHNDLRGEIATLMRRLENARADLETQKFAALARPDMSSPAKKPTREIESEDELATPPGSPPLSPIKGTPHRNATLESETLKGTLFHNQTKMLRQRKELEKEKSQRLQLQRQVRDLEEELLSMKQLHDSQPNKRRRRAGEDAHKSRQRMTKDIFGVGRRPTSAVSSVEDDFWDEAESGSDDQSATGITYKSHKHSEKHGRDINTSDLDSNNQRSEPESPETIKSFSTVTQDVEHGSDTEASDRSMTSPNFVHGSQQISPRQLNVSKVFNKPQALDAELEGLFDGEVSEQGRSQTMLPTSTRDASVMTEEPWPTYPERSLEALVPESSQPQTEMTFILEDPATFDSSTCGKDGYLDEEATLPQHTDVLASLKSEPLEEKDLDSHGNLPNFSNQAQPADLSSDRHQGAEEALTGTPLSVSEVILTSDSHDKDLIEPSIVILGNAASKGVSSRGSQSINVTCAALGSVSQQVNEATLPAEERSTILDTFMSSTKDTGPVNIPCTSGTAQHDTDEGLVTISEIRLSELQKNEHDLYATRASLEQLTREKLELLSKLAAATTTPVTLESFPYEAGLKSEDAVAVVDALEVSTPHLRPISVPRVASYASYGLSATESVLESDTDVPSPERIRQLRTQRYLYSSPTAKAERILGKSPSGTNLTSSKSISRSLRSKSSFEQMQKSTEIGMAPPLAPSTARDTIRTRQNRTRTIAFQNEDESDDCRGVYSGQLMRSSYVPPARSYSQRSLSSISSFATEIDDRFRTTAPLTDNHALAESPTDPATIESITRTMIGMSMYKYTRRAGRQGLSENRHKRYFWIHPYTKTLYWSVYNPVNAPEGAIIKSAPILTVHVEDDFNTLPPGLHQRSICIETPRRTLKLTAIQTVDHEDWVRALNFLLYGLPAPEQSAEDARETDTIIRQFSPTKSAASPNRSPSRRRYSSSFVGHFDSQKSIRPSSSLSKKISTYFSKSTEPTIENFDLVKGTAWKGSMAMRDSISQREGLTLDNVADGPGLENVRSCCGGRHDVSDLCRRPASRSSSRSRLF